MIYIHIPFCKQACSYCNFHFSTSLQNKAALLQALEKELELRRDYLPDRQLSSVYFGGGTPSLLSVEELNSVIDKINTYFTIGPDAEITLEANPDDLTKDKVAQLQDTPVNRLSIGVQSFYDDELMYMNRAHNAVESMRALELVNAADFRSWTMDLIYGTPLLTEERWRESLERVADLGAPHLSAYQLTIEPKTVLAHQIRQGQSPAPDDAATAIQFEMLMDWADAAGYEHYEISNLAIPGHRAMHNSNYWKGQPYLGIGPSAHSFDGRQREWNISNNALYIKRIDTGSAREDSEILSIDERYNEYVMTGLRTIEGINEEQLIAFGANYHQHFIAGAETFIRDGLMQQTERGWALTRSGKLLADRIASELFFVHEGHE